MKKPVVAAFKTSPEKVRGDIPRLMELAGLRDALDQNVVTILKDNLSWHYPFLSANTTPWQLEGTILGLRKAGFSDLVAVYNNTVVTDPFRGGKLNKLEPIYRRYDIIEKYNFRPRDIIWEVYEPKARLRALHNIYPKGIKRKGSISQYGPGRWRRLWLRCRYRFRENQSTPPETVSLGGVSFIA